MSQKGQNQTVLITGASSGIGEYTAYEAAANGYNLVLCARRIERLNTVKENCEKLGAVDVKVYSVDIANPDSIDGMVNWLTTNDIKIDVLINNAGYGHSEPFVEVDFDVVEDLFKVNVLGLMYLSQKIALMMLDHQEGQIINIASLAGKVSTPNYAIYGATKGALISFSNAFRMELKPANIQVTTVNFGPVDTPFFENIERSRREASANSQFTLTVQEAAKIVYNTIGTKKREVNRPLLLAAGAKLYEFIPAIGDYMLLKFFRD